jgi:hypothetical protein
MTHAAPEARYAAPTPEGTTARTTRQPGSTTYSSWTKATQALLAFNTAFLVLLFLLQASVATPNTNRFLGSSLCSRLGSTSSI